jgi:glutamate synthase (NADPH/NADH) small chain
VTLFDRWPRLGGLLRYGIPAFKLQPDVVDRKEERLLRLGLEFRGNVEVGIDPTIQGLLSAGFDAVFIGVGAPVDSGLRVEGADLQGVHRAMSFLVRGNVPREELPSSWRDTIDVRGQNVVVLGGGDTAMDCLRTALRLGANKVSCVYRRDEANMPGARKEKKMATEEGVEWIWLAAPLRFIGKDGRVAAVECQRMQLGEPDASGRRSPVPIEGETFTVPCTTVVLALGFNNEDTVPANTPGMKHNKWFQIEVDPATGATSVPGVFAGGDAVSGADLVVTAVVAGRKAAEAIHAHVTGNPPAG